MRNGYSRAEASYVRFMSITGGIPQGNFEGLGWSVRLQQKRTNFFLTLAKEIVVGNALKKGDAMFYYLINCQGRKAVLVFLDGQERPDAERLRLNGTTFLVRA